MKKIPVLIAAMLLLGCGQDLSRQKVLDTFDKAGIQATNIVETVREPGQLIPDKAKDEFTFVLPEIAPRGGQAFICENRTKCDPFFIYFDGQKFMDGPFFYRSKSGKVIVTIDNTASVETTQKFEQAMDRL